MDLVQTKKQIRRHFFHVGFAFCALAVLSTVLQTLSAYICVRFFPAVLQNSWGYFAVMMLPWYLLSVPYCLILLRMNTFGRPPKQRLGTGNFWCMIPVSIFFIYTGNLIGIFFNTFISQIIGSTPSNDVSNLVSQSNPLTVFVFAVVLAPVVEEFLFRKFLIDAVYPFGEIPAILLSGLMFGAFHGNFYQFFYAAALGCVFAYIYCKTGRVIYTVVLHAVLNFLGSVVAPAVISMLDMRALQSGDIAQLLADNPLGLLIYIGYAVFMLGMAVLGLVLLIVKRRSICFLKGKITASADSVILNAGMILYFVLCLALFIQSIF